MPIIKVNDIDLHYEIYGQGEPLLFIAGFSADHTLWDTLVGAYSPHYQVILFDNRGSGLSGDKPDYPYTAQVLADDAIALLQALDITQAHIVGHSYGGCVAQTLAAKYPNFVKSITLANTFISLAPRSRLFLQARVQLQQALAPEAALIPLVSLMGFSNAYLSKTNRIEHLLKVGLRSPSLPGLQHQLEGVLAFDSSSWISTIKKPCLIICAAEDFMASVADAQQIKSALVEPEYFCFKQVGHLPMLEHTEMFNKVLLQFLAKH